MDSVTLITLGFVVAIAIPLPYLLAAAICCNAPSLQIVVLGPFILSDALLAMWLLRTAPLILSDGRPDRIESRGSVLPYFAMLMWALLAAAVVGAPSSAILRLLLYGGVMWLLTRLDSPVAERRGFVWSIYLFALANVVGGIAEGQERLVGLYVQDPSQMGGLLLGAGILLRSVTTRVWVLGLAVLPLLAGVWLTQTRGVWFAFLVLAVLIGLRRQLTFARLIVALAFGSVIGFTLVDWITSVFDLNVGSKEFRIDTFRSGVRVVLADPFFGSGWARTLDVDALGEFVEGVAKTVPYNLVLGVAAYAGVPAAVSLLAFLRNAVNGSRGSDGYWFVIVVCAMSVTEMTLYAGSLLTLLFLVVVGSSLSRSVEPRKGVEQDDALSLASSTAHDAPTTGGDRKGRGRSA